MEQEHYPEELDIKNSEAVNDGDPHWFYNEDFFYTVVYTRLYRNVHGVSVSELWTMELDLDFSVLEGSVRRLTNPCYKEEDEDYQYYYVHPEYISTEQIYPLGACDVQGEDIAFGDYDPKISPDGEYIAFERHIGPLPAPGVNPDWDMIVVKIGPEGFQHDAPVYEGTIWNVTHHFDGGHGYSWSTEFLPHWKIAGLTDYDLTYTVVAIRTAGDALGDFYDQFKQTIDLENDIIETEREKRPLETPARLDNFIDERGIWFPDGTELLFFRELGTPLNEEEQVKRLPARKW